MVDTLTPKVDTRFTLDLSTALPPVDRAATEGNSLPQPSGPDSLISSALRELRSLVVRTPGKDAIQSISANIAQRFVDKASSDELQQLACRCRAQDSTKKVELLTRLQSDTRQEACRIAQTPASPELNALALSLISMTPRARGEFIVEALGRDRLRSDNPGTYERGVAAVIRLTSTMEDTRAYLARMQPGILKKMQERQLASDLALTAVAATTAIPTVVREQARVVLRQGQLITEGLRTAVASVIGKLLTAAVERQLRQNEPHVVKEFHDAANSFPLVPRGSSTLTENGAQPPAPNRLVALLNIAESARNEGIGSKISAELVATGLALLATAREEEQRRKTKEQSLELRAQEARERAVESILRHLDPAIDAILMQSVSQEDFLGPIAFRALPEALLRGRRARVG